MSTTVTVLIYTVGYFYITDYIMHLLVSY